MWRGYVGLNIQMLYTTNQLSGTFVDPMSGQLAFDYELGQFDFPIMFKAAYPTRYVTPSISVGPMLRKDHSDSTVFSLSGGEADVRAPFGFSTEHWLTRFGAGLETKLPFKGRDIRLSLDVMVNYDGQIADGFEGDEVNSLCQDYEDSGTTERVCLVDHELGTVWRTDVMLGLGYHF